MESEKWSELGYSYYTYILLARIKKLAQIGAGEVVALKLYFYTR